MEATASTLVMAASACEHMFEAGRGGAQNGDGMADEQPPYVPIVREPELQRLAAAGRAVLAELSRLHDAVGHRPDLLAGLYAARALVADDEHGWRHGLVVQADSLRWTELERLAELVAPHLDADRHAGAGSWHVDCPQCQALLTVARIRARYRYRTVNPRR